ncbi:MAG: hypothetical protein WDA75_18670 [Candidatus Latescibacterota bacterium]
MRELHGALLDQLRHDAEPYHRAHVLIHIVGRDPGSREVRIVRDEIPDTVLVKTLLAERQADGRIPLPPDDRWRGAHWVLVTLAELAYPEGDQGLAPLREQVLEWLGAPEHPREIAGRRRWPAVQGGNALWALLSLGLADERTEELARRLREGQRPDGGWNRGLGPAASPSSFTEILIPLRALALHAHLAGSAESTEAAARAAEVLLSRGLYRRPQNGEVIRRDFLSLRYPSYGHYDLLFGLKVLAEAGQVTDPRCSEALDLLEAKQLPDGGFPAEAKHYRVGRQEGGNAFPGRLGRYPPAALESLCHRRCLPGPSGRGKAAGRLVPAVAHGQLSDHAPASACLRGPLLPPAGMRRRRAAAQPG